MSFSKTIRDAAFTVLLPPGKNANALGKHGGWKYHRYSCNAIQFAYPGQGTPETIAASDWYYKTVLCADREFFPAATISDCEGPQEIRFMLMLFASYLAADEGL